MAEITNEEIRNLILALDKRLVELDKKIDSRFVELDRKIDTRFVELDKKIDSRFVELDKKIDDLDRRMQIGFAEVEGKFGEIRGEIKTVRVEISEVRAELKGDIRAVEAKLEGFDKRISYQEFASRSIFVTVLGGILLALARFFFTFDPKRLIAQIVDLCKTIGLS